MDSVKIARAEKLFYQDVLKSLLKSSVSYLLNIGFIILGAYIAFRYIQSLELEEEVSKYE
jgi:hypothetical protein